MVSADNAEGCVATSASGFPDFRIQCVWSFTCSCCVSMGFYRFSGFFLSPRTSIFVTFC